LGLFFIVGRAYGLVLVHKTHSLAPKTSSSINVVANGARYRFIVSIGVVKVENGFVYATDGYKYKQSSIQWTVSIPGESEVGIITTEGEESGNNYLKSLQWQTPILNKSYTVKVSGKRWPYVGSGGGGPYDPYWESTSSGQITNPIIYNTALIKEGNQYTAGQEVSVEKSEVIMVKTYAGEGTGSPITNSQVTVFWKLKDPDPVNQGSGSLAHSSSTTDNSGEATNTLTCSDKHGDDHIVTAQDKDTNPASSCDSGKVVMWNLKITSFTPRTFTTQTGENQISCVADIKPDSLDATYNGNIEWDIEDNPNVGGDSGNPNDPNNGNTITWSASIPPIPRDSDGRGFPLSYRIRARLTIGSDTVISDTFITQDEIDQCRQEYVDFNYSRDIPERNRFTQTKHSNHYSFGNLNSGDYSWAIIEDNLLNGLEATGTNFPNNWENLSCAYRNPIHNANVGGVLTSWHLEGRAADIDGDSYEENYKIYQAMAGTGFIERIAEPDGDPNRSTWIHGAW